MKNFRLQIGSNMECSLCNEGDESIDHLFLNCKWYWNIWISCMKWWGVSFCVPVSLLEWWKCWIGICTKNLLERAWFSLFFVVTWSIWEAMNGKVFRNVEVSNGQVQDMIRFRVAWWFKFLGKGSNDPVTHIMMNINDCCTESIKVKVLKMLDWIPPPLDVPRFNVDKSARGSPGQTGIGGVLRNHNGKVLCKYSVNISIQDAISVEIQVIAKACSLCVNIAELCGTKIVFTSDSKSAVSWIDSTNLGNLSHLHLILDISCMLGSLGQASMEYCSRNTNSVADFLAKKSDRGDMDVLIWSLA
ncbi:hypothetical protein Dsin_019535 [Dipteronia sinensis]|uniref:RNase H type-1 domain-containing protein n=1 Tax=Dipteronia sinensis TaxID=43782 RepID=A0AAE0A888_9ROSI|nr:hypothetical protein Dsin_019535 [Dipteronia sinensis]